MTREALLWGLEDFIPWARGLIGSDTTLWLEPMAPGQWSVGECLAHLLFWEWFALGERLPALAPEVSLRPAPSAQSLNDRAAFYARSGISRERLVGDFVIARQSLVTCLRALPPDAWEAVCFIGGEATTLALLALELLRHNAHHQRQISAFLSRSSHPVLGPLEPQPSEPAQSLRGVTP